MGRLSFLVEAAIVVVVDIVATKEEIVGTAIPMEGQRIAGEVPASVATAVGRIVVGVASFLA